MLSFFHSSFLAVVALLATTSAPPPVPSMTQDPTVVWSALQDDGSILATHVDGTWTLSHFAPETGTVARATATIGKAPQGPSQLPSVSVGYKDANGQQVTVSVPLTADTEADIERIAKLAKRLNEEMRKQFPPAPPAPASTQ